MEARGHLQIKHNVVIDRVKDNVSPVYLGACCGSCNSALGRLKQHDHTVMPTGGLCVCVRSWGLMTEC